MENRIDYSKRDDNAYIPGIFQALAMGIMAAIVYIWLFIEESENQY
jgi:hypothetical protein